jgi:hypothetical protein
MIKIDSNVPISGDVVKGDCYNESRNKFRHARIAAGLCRDCGKVPPLDDKVVCETCSKRRANNGKKYQANAIVKGICTNCGKKNERRNRILCNACSEVYMERGRQTRKRNKLKVIEFFGGCCKKCSEDDPRVLTLHHANGDGAEDRKSNSKKGKIDTPTWYARLYRCIIEDKPIERELELLCYNCHFKEDLAPWWLK